MCFLVILLKNKLTIREGFNKKKLNADMSATPPPAYMLQPVLVDTEKLGVFLGSEINLYL